MTEIVRKGSGGPWEERIGYSRVVRAGPMVFVSGCTSATADGGIEGEGDPYAQALVACRKIEAALAQVDASLADVVQTRMYVTDMTQWEHVTRAHAEVFGQAPPAAAILEIKGMIDPRMLVEIDAIAYAIEQSSSGA